MGIKFACPHCGTSLNVKSELAGKRGRCPQCQQKIEIPQQDSPSSGAVDVAAAQVAGPATGAPGPAPAVEPASQPLPQSTVAAAAGASAPASDAISEAPKLQWYVMPPGAASQYGPAIGEEFRNWIKEGRVTADTLVWRQDWPEWKLAGAVFPELQPQAAGQAPVASVAPAGFAIPTAAGALPTAAGLAPVGVAAYPAAGDAAAPWNPAAGGFSPVGGGAPTSSVRRTQYRRRSNTGPMIVIGVLVLAMIPLSYFVWKVVSDQFRSPPPAASPKKQAE
ncbi:MAG TPA: GYF domain-containing protein [Pirellulales bacterium]|nr:GYF domain-containing protein [Pirellulales bacterium]